MSRLPKQINPKITPKYAVGKGNCERVKVFERNKIPFENKVFRNNLHPDISG